MLDEGFSVIHSAGALNLISPDAGGVLFCGPLMVTAAPPVPAVVPAHAGAPPGSLADLRARRTELAPQNRPLFCAVRTGLRPWLYQVPVQQA